MSNPSEKDMLIALKQKANMLGITYSPNIGLEKLKEKVDAKMAEQPEVDPVETGAIAPSANQIMAAKKKAASKLVRIRLTTVDQNKKDWPGEMFSVGNRSFGMFKKYIPFGVEWHLPQIIIDTIQEKQCQIFVSNTDSKGNSTKTPKLVKAYNIDFLEPLSSQELQDLAKAQQASGRLEEE